MERAWRSLTPEERSTALDHVKPWLEAAEKAGRKHVPAGSTYLRNKPWEIHEAKDEARPAAAQKQLVPPFSKLWWWVLWWLIGKGERVGFMIQQAQQNTSWAIAAEDAPSDEQLGLLWRQGPDDPGFVEWVKHMRQRGVRLPRPDVAPYVWTPSEYPEGAAGSALAGQPASRPAGRMGQEAADAIEDMAEEHIG